MKDYARQRGLSLWEHWQVPDATQLLRHGFTQETRNVMRGTLPGEMEGTLADFGYVVNRGGEMETRRFTVVLSSVPGSVRFATRILCHDRSLPQEDRANPDRDKEIISLDDRAVRLESEEFLGRYTLSVDHDQDENRVWQLFEPSFIDWLTSSAPPRFSFEIQDGSVCCFVPGALEQPERLDALCDAAARVDQRLRQEIAEEASIGDEAAPSTVIDPREEQLRQRLARVQWDKPPEEVKAAAKAYKSGMLLGEADWRLGAEAFFREWGRTHGFQSESLASFRARDPKAILPGPAVSALRGPLAAGQAASIVLIDLDGSTDRGWTGLVTAVGPRRFPEVSSDGTAKGLHSASNGRTLTLLREDGGARNRSRTQLDAFFEEAQRELVGMLVG